MSGGEVSWRSQRDVRQALLDAAGETGRYALDDEQPMLLAWLCEGALLDLLSALNAATGTRHFIAASDDRDSWYAYTTRNRQWRLGAAADWALDAASDSVTGAGGWRVSADALVNRETATAEEPSPPDWPTVVWQYPALPCVVRLGSSLTVSVAFADYVLDGPSVGLVFAAGSLGTAEYQHHGQTGTLTITAVDADATLTGVGITGHIVDRAPSTSHTADDTASQALPRGLRQGPGVGGDLAGPLATSGGLADHVVWRYAGMPGRGGILRPSVTAANWLPSGFRAQLCDTVAFSSPQLAVSGRVMEIIGLDETCVMAASSGAVLWTQTLQLQESRIQPGDGSPAFLTLDASATDGPDVLAY